MIDNLFTVIITSYNNHEFINDCLKSVFQQTYEAIELIISDDNSKLFNKREIEKFIEYNARDNIISTIININNENIGSVKNINKAIRLSSGKYIMILSCDDMLYDKTVLKNIVNFMEEEGCHGVVGFIEINDTKMQNAKAIFPRRYALDYVNSNKPINIYYKLCERVILPGPGFTFKREVIDIFGFYDENYKLVEDYPRFLYLIRNGCNIKFIDKILIKYRDGGITNQTLNSENAEVKKIIKDDLKLAREKEIIPYIEGKK